MRSSLAVRVAFGCTLAVCASCGRIGFESKRAYVPATDAGAPTGTKVDGRRTDQGSTDEGSTNDADGGSASTAPSLASDAAVADADVDAAPAPPTTPSFDCAQFPSALACESFDQNAIGATSWLEGNRGMASVTSEMLVASIDAGGGHAALGLRIGLHTNGTLFLRMRLEVPSAFAIDDLNIVAFSNDARDADMNIELIAPDTMDLTRGFEGSIGRKSLTLQRHAWMCLSARLDIDGTNGAFDVQLADTQVTASGEDTLPPDGIDQLRIGIDWSSRNQAPAEVRIDDVLVSETELLGCP